MAAAGSKAPNAPKNLSASRAAGSGTIVLKWDAGDGAGSGERKWTKSTKVTVAAYRKGKAEPQSTSEHSVGSGTREYKHTVNKSKWHPFTDLLYDKLVFTVQSRNGAGYSKAATYSMPFHSVGAPEAVEVGIDYSTGVVTASAKAADYASGSKMGYRTRTTVWVERSINGGDWARVGGESSHGEGEATVTASYDAHADGSTAKSVQFRAAARNDGPAGASKVAYSTSKTKGADASKGKVTVAEPLQPAVGGIELRGSGAPSGQSVYVHFSTWASDERPVTEVVLQRLRNFDMDEPPWAAAQSGDWADVASSDGNCTGLGDAYSDGMSDAGGTRTWYRVKSSHGNFPPKYSEPATADFLLCPRRAVATGPVAVTGLEPRADGTSLAVTLEWPGAVGGVELSWSADPDAWASTDGPKTHLVEPPAAGGALSSPMTYYITGLEEGKACFVKARSRDADDGGQAVYGAYSDAAMAVPASVPAGVVAAAPSYVMRGEGVPVSWRFTSDMEQSAWSVTMGGVPVLSGEGAARSAVLPAATVGAAPSVSVGVMVTTGGMWAGSDEVEVAVVDAPSCALSAPAALEAQPLAVEVETDCADPVLSLSVLSSGCSEGTTYRERAQADGDVVWAGSFRPDELGWRESAGGMSAHVALPGGLDLRDGVEYAVAARVKSARWGVPGEQARALIAVAWSHRAAAPSGTARPDLASMSCAVTVEAPEGAAEGDVFDLYRVTPDGDRLIAEGAAFGSTLVDPYAPFCAPGTGAELGYRAVTRTADGDTAGSGDIAYELAGAGVRLDWDGKSLELPYNVRWSDSWEKDFAASAHLDGSVAGRWNPAVARSATMEADLAPLDARSRGLLAEAARYPGPVMVRTSRGLAFPADVQPSEVAYEHGSRRVSVSLSIREVDGGGFGAEGAE